MSDSPALTAEKPAAAGRARRRAPSAARQAARDEVAEAMKARLDAAIAALGDEEKWIETLDVIAQFGAKYSLGNQLLILLACQARGFAPTFVQSFNSWKAQAKHDSAICQGPKLKVCGCDLNVPQRPAGTDPDAPFGIPIWAPRKRKLTKQECDKRETETGKKLPRDAQGRSLNKVLAGFQPTYVFDASQLKRPTEAEIPPPIAVRRRIKVHGGARPELLTGDDTTGALADVIALIKAAGVAFEYVDPATLGGANGRTDGKTVWVRNDVDDAQKVKTALHELAHILLGHVDPAYGYAQHRGKAETEAESIAYIVCGALGLDTGKYSAPYVNSWSEGDCQVIRAAAETVLRVAKQILAALDSTELVDGEADEMAGLVEAA